MSIKPRHRFSKSLLRKYLRYNRDGSFTVLKQRSYLSVGDIVRGTLHHSGYLRIRFLGKQCAFHRLVWAYHNGHTSKQIDHRDRNRSNPKIGNLRLADHSQQMFNTGINVRNTSGHRGVSKIKGTRSWEISIMINGRRKKLGQSTSLTAATTRYKNAAMKHRGSFYGS